MNKKKTYEVPQMKAHQVKAESIICTSGGTTQMSVFGTNPTHGEDGIGIPGGNGGDCL